MKLRTPFPLALLAVCLATMAHAQSTTVDIGPTNCGRGQAFNCHLSVVNASGTPTGGTVWLDYIPNSSHFIQFSIAEDANNQPLVGTAYNVVASIVAMVPITTTTATNSYRIDIASFSFVDSNGAAVAGKGVIYYHYRWVCCGSGRGGGAGWYLTVDQGTISLN